MLIGKGMSVAGSVSGGCIEGAVIEEALDALENGESRQLSFGVEDELALSVGLSCGGEVSVLLEKHWAFSSDPNTRKVWETLAFNLNSGIAKILLNNPVLRTFNRTAPKFHFLISIFSGDACHKCLFFLPKIPYSSLIGPNADSQSR